MENKKPIVKRFVKYLLFCGGGLLILLALAYFIGTSGWFIRTVILPRVGKTVNANITAGDISLSPFSKIEIKNLALTTTDNRPIASFSNISARYDLMKILRGNIEVGEVILDSPVINYEINEDGTSNIDKLGGTSAPSPKPSQTARPLNLFLGSLVINNGTVNFTQKSKTGSINAVVNNLNLKINGVKNGGAPSLSLSAIWNLVISSATNKNELNGNAKANLELSLNTELMPQNGKGNVELNVNRATGDFSDVGGISAILNLDAGLNEIKNLNLKFSRANESLGTITVAGAYDINKKEADIKLNIEKISGAVLTLAGAKFGMAITSDGLDSALAVRVANKGNTINTRGNLNCLKLGINKSGMQTPVVDIKSQFDIAADLSNSNAVVRAFDLNINQNNKQILALNLSKELAVNWGKTGGDIGDSALNLAVSSLNLADWRGLIGTNIESGIINSKASAVIKNGGKSVTFDVNGDISKLNARFQSNSIQNGGIEFELNGNLDNFSLLKLSNAKANININSHKAVKLSAAGEASIDNLTANFTVSTEADLGRLTQFIPDIPDAKIQSGVVAFSGKISQQIARDAKTNLPIQTVIGTIALSDFSAVIMSNKISNLNLRSDVDIARKGDSVSINNVVLQINRNNKPAGELLIKGTVDLKNNDGDIALVINNLNQEIIIPFASQYLGERKLKTVLINANLSAGKSSQKDSKLNGKFEIRNLLVEDPQGILPAKPVDIISQIDLLLTPKGVADIKRMNVVFNQAGKFAGEFDCSGSYNLSNNACQIKLNLKDINQEGLSPFLPPIAGIGTIKTISINGALQANVEPKTDSSIVGNLNITNLLIIGTNKLPASLPLALAFDLSTKISSKGMISIERFSGNIKEGESPAGNFSITGSYNTNNGFANGSVKLENLTHNALKAFINPFLEGKLLKQVSINANLVGDYKPNADSSLKGELKALGLSVEDPVAKKSTAPVDVALSLNGSLVKQALDIQRFRISLSPTKLAENQIDVTGKIDFSKTNAIAGKIDLTSDSFDLTPIYNMFAGSTTKEESKPKSKQEPAKSVDTEPPPITLPLSNFVFNALVKRFYLNQLAITNIVVSSKINGGMVELDPCQLSLNGTPVNFKSKLNLSVPGYQYDLTLKAYGLDLTPIVASLKPDLAATLNGTIYSDISVKGAGTTGKSLRESLNGNVGIIVTNANIQVISKTAKVILTPIALILGIPEILNSPVKSMATDIKLGQGNIDIRKFEVQSSAFIINSSGTIPIADILTNSPLDFPIEFWLKSELARRFVIQNVQPGEYVKLPNFAQVKGTLGNPDVKIDKLKIAALTMVGVGGSAGNKAGNIIRGIGGILSGQSLAPSNQPAQQPANQMQEKSAPTNSPINQLFNIFKKPKN